MWGISKGDRVVATRRTVAAAVATALGLTGLAASSSSAPVQETAVAASTSEATDTITVAESVDRACFERQLEGARGVAAVTLNPALGSSNLAAVEARLDGPTDSDWDVAVFDQAGGVVAAGSSPGADEVASGYVASEGPLTVQACRISGAGTVAELSVDLAPLRDSGAGKSSLVTVKTPTTRDKDLLTSLGLDMTEHGGEDHMAVVLHGKRDAEALERVGLEYEVDVADLAAQAARQARANAEYARQTKRTSLPSGQDTYRRLFDYTQELKDLAKDNPDIVTPLTLNHKTYEGRTVEGIEITTNPGNLRDGKPIFLQMGVHHAREWPSGEHAMEWAYELIKGYKKGDARVTRLVENSRTIVIPVVNPDGFNASREAGEQQGSGNGEDLTFVQSAATSYNEYRRKNCRIVDQSQQGNCNAPAFGVASIGVDPNRNYGGFWGGPGASDVPAEEDYRGPGPFSEPETQNIRELVSARQVTNAISNHTFSNLVIRPPSVASDPVAPDEPVYKALGDAMAAQNGYISQYSYELYDTSGGYEDWAYYATGGLGFTFEIYCNHVADPLDDRCSGNFHPGFEKIVAEYEGSEASDAPAGGGGNREAYFIAQEAALDPQLHSVLKGQAPAGAILKVEKSFTTPTRNEDQPEFEDHLESEMKVPDSGSFDWHINPSTRPLVASARGRQALGPVSGPAEVTPPGGTNATTQPCANFDTTDPTCFNDHRFTIPGAPADNESATVEMHWTNPANDWDMKIFRDSNGDGLSWLPDGPDEGTEPDNEELVDESGNSAPGTSESSTFVRPETGDGRLQPGQYVIRAVNFAAVTPDPYTLEVTFEAPEEYVPPKTETWKFTCTFAGETRVTQDILIARGEAQTLDLAACGTGTGGPRSCQGKNATLVGSKGADAIIGSKGNDVIVGLGGNDKLRGRGGNDVICAKGGRDNVGPGAGNDRVTLGGGNDRANGAKGNDKVKGGAGKDRLAGAKGNDKLSGGGAKDRLRGGKGRDRLRGGGGTDRCAGGPGPDRESSC